MRPPLLPLSECVTPLAVTPQRWPQVGAVPIWPAGPGGVLAGVDTEGRTAVVDLGFSDGGQDGPVQFGADGDNPESRG